MTRRDMMTIAGAAVVVSACRRQRRSPEQRVRALLAAVEEAVEAGDLDRVREALAPGFRGGELDRQAAMTMLQFQLRARKQIYLISRILDVDAMAGVPARADVLVAMAAVPISGPEALPGLEADVYRFQLVLEEDADAPKGYRVTTATWSPARWGEKE